MTRILTALLLAAPLALTAAAPSAARRANDLPPAVPTGPARDCVQIRDLGDSVVRNDRVIDFVRGRSGYRVTLEGACPGLALDRAFTYTTSLSQLCKQDIITVLRTTGGIVMRGASCGLAPFQPVSYPKRR